MACRPSAVMRNKARMLPLEILRNNCPRCAPPSTDRTTCARKQPHRPVTNRHNNFAISSSGVEQQQLAGPPCTQRLAHDSAHRPRNMCGQQAIAPVTTLPEPSPGVAATTKKERARRKGHARPRQARCSSRHRAPTCVDHGATNCAMACRPSAVMRNKARMLPLEILRNNCPRCAPPSTDRTTCARKQPHRPVTNRHNNFAISSSGVEQQQLAGPPCTQRLAHDSAHRPRNMCGQQAIALSRGNRHFTVGGGRLHQSGPRPEGRLLRQPALEGLTRSARTDSPRQVGRNKFRRSKAATQGGF
ncbi:hypothetical protein F511_35265 [Dorcoceras hygrometricum]|uniref:Uncharacterized protein n=1 Tax=Dorcoceras hygrometricum TaxID=472368 RepID=A0A2Z7CCS7_9LAMI|nr:hypothetical protein F511_35265 [Dorcoceras hygrometricum]